MSSLDDVDSHELARSTGINLRYCETFRSVIRLFFWNDNQVLGYPVRRRRPSRPLYRAQTSGNQWS